jgi:hypothetical protein
VTKRSMKISSTQGERSIDVEVLIGSDVEFSVSGWRDEVKTYRADNLFHALCKFRLELEEEGYTLLCNGARKDAYPSRMALDMGRGKKLYLHKPGVQSGWADLVDVLDEAVADQVCFVSEQRVNYELWLGSLGFEKN